MIDFELALKNTLEEVFSLVSVSCCFFYPGRSVYRREQNEGLQEQYNNPGDSELRDGTHCILGSSKGLDSGRCAHRVGPQNKPIRSSGCERSGDAGTQVCR